MWRDRRAVVRPRRNRTTDPYPPGCAEREGGEIKSPSGRSCATLQDARNHLLGRRRGFRFGTTAPPANRLRLAHKVALVPCSERMGRQSGSMVAFVIVQSVPKSARCLQRLPKISRMRTMMSPLAPPGHQGDIHPPRVGRVGVPQTAGIEAPSGNRPWLSQLASAGLGAPLQIAAL